VGPVWGTVRGRDTVGPVWGTAGGQECSGTRLGHSEGPRTQWHLCGAQRGSEDTVGLPWGQGVKGTVGPLWGHGKGNSETRVGHSKGPRMRWDPQPGAQDTVAPLWSVVRV